MGGEIAFEIGQQLRRQGDQVNLLVMFDTKYVSYRANSVPNVSSLPPVTETPAPSSRRSVWREKIALHFRRFARLNAKEKFEYILHDLTYRIERVLVFSLARTLRILGRRLPDWLLLNYLRKCHTEALHSYSPRWYPGRVTLFRASETLSSEPEDSSNGWHSLAGGGLEVFYFNATHNLLSARYAQEVAHQLIACLVQAQNHR